MRLRISALCLSVVLSTLPISAQSTSTLTGPGTGTAQEAGQQTSAVNIDFTTVPNPPHKGMNTLRVKLTNAKGISVAGAEITVKFFMAAMPEMGMAAMSTSAKLIQKSDALYEGQGNLGSGGGWRVTITVQRKGQTVVTKEMHVNAEGGM